MGGDGVANNAQRITTGSGLGQAATKIFQPEVAASVLGSAGSFFLLSNLAVWVEGGLYPHTLAGLGACYMAAIPFFANDLASTALTATVLFGLPLVAAQLVRSWRDASERQQPLL